MTSAPTIAIGPDSHNNDRNTLANEDSKTPLFQTLFQLTGNRCEIPRKRQGHSSFLDPDTNEQVALVAEALRSAIAQ